MWRQIGAQLGSAIITMSNNGLDIQNLQLIAHSLGAHLMGYAGKQVKKEGKIVGRSLRSTLLGCAFYEGLGS
ncbi:unnamed protein product [Leptidea sinapis]|uniref:Uncharacterized protein n=1 Tax=Leptidea sinapis TaxID=189913 RepID=A0A5E4PVC2_9NEOP|nr:unnamed protein product [Leptidea sinapis]